MSFTLEEFFFNTPIYTPIVIENLTDNEVRSLTSYYYGGDKIEGYNPWQKIQSTFTLHTRLPEAIWREGGFAIIQLKCKRYGDIFNYYVFWDLEKKHLMKVGQYPTVADFHISEIKQYKKLLSEEKLKEFTRAIGLAANGVGIGSFVYLRRVFETLINEAFQITKAENEVMEETFQKARMDEKIDLLQKHLPSFLVENKGMYSILSLGIHELDEDTCLAHFDTLRVGIEIILDEKLEELRKKEKIESAKQKLSQIKGQLNK